MQGSEQPILRWQISDAHTQNCFRLRQQQTRSFNSSVVRSTGFASHVHVRVSLVVNIQRHWGGPLVAWTFL